MSLTPGSPEWCRIVTASKVAAILGHSPFESQRSMWHLMRGEYVPAENDAMRRGTYLESGVLAWWVQEHGAHVLKSQSSYTLGDWAAATPDVVAEVQIGEYEGAVVLVEAKTSSNADEWGEPGTDEIPTHYLTQCYWQMHVSGIHECRVPVLTSRLQFAEYVVKHDVEVGKLLEARCKAFYDSLSSDTPPPLDDSVATLECLRHLHPDITPGTSCEVPYELALDFVDYSLDVKHYQKCERRERIRLHDIDTTAQYLTCNGVRFARRQAKGDAVTIVRILDDPDLLTEPETAA